MIRAASGTIVSPGFLHLPLPPAQLCRFTVELLEAPMAGVDEQSITLAFNNFDVSANDRLQVDTLCGIFATFWSMKLTNRSRLIA